MRWTRSGVPSRPWRPGSSPISSRISRTASSTAPSWTTSGRPLAPVISPAATSLSPISDSISSTRRRTCGGRSVGLVIWAMVRGPADGRFASGLLAVRAELAEARRRQRLVLAALGAAPPCPGVRPKRWPVVAALLEDHEPPAERRDPPAALVVDGRRQGEVADGVVAVRVKPERDDDHVAGRRRDLLEALVERREIAVVVDPGGQREVQVRAAPLALAGFVGP